MLSNPTTGFADAGAGPERLQQRPPRARNAGSGGGGVRAQGEALETIEAAVRAAARGESWLSPKVAAKVMKKALGKEEAEEEAIPLTERELEVLRLIAKGWSNKRIAKGLGIGERTVAFHVENLLAKLGADNRTEAVVEAIRRGWLAV